MGLDMYLNGPRGEEVGYWRKANQIHRWFVANVQGGTDDCRPYPVSGDQLRASCVLVDGDVTNGYTFADATRARELLPTKTGFFFGDTDYDEYYVEDLDLTKEIIERALAMPEDSRFVYRSSW